MLHLHDLGIMTEGHYPVMIKMAATPPDETQNIRKNVLTLRYVQRPSECMCGWPSCTSYYGNETNFGNRGIEIHYSNQDRDRDWVRGEVMGLVDRYPHITFESRRWTTVERPWTTVRRSDENTG